MKRLSTGLAIAGLAAVPIGTLPDAVAHGNDKAPRPATTANVTTAAQILGAKIMRFSHLHPRATTHDYIRDKGGTALATSVALSVPRRSDNAVNYDIGVTYRLPKNKRGNKRVTDIAVTEAIYAPKEPFVDIDLRQDEATGNWQVSGTYSSKGHTTFHDLNGGTVLHAQHRLTVRDVSMLATQIEYIMAEEARQDAAPKFLPPAF